MRLQIKYPSILPHDDAYLWRSDRRGYLPASTGLNPDTNTKP